MILEAIKIYFTNNFLEHQKIANIILINLRYI